VDVYLFHRTQSAARQARSVDSGFQAEIYISNADLVIVPDREKEDDSQALIARASVLPEFTHIHPHVENRYILVCTHVLAPGSVSRSTFRVLNILYRNILSVSPCVAFEHVFKKERAYCCQREGGIFWTVGLASQYVGMMQRGGLFSWALTKQTF